jgi:molecular chaperone HscB
MLCWSCNKDGQPGPFCPSCGKIQPPPARGESDHFATLGLPRDYALSRDALDERYRDLQRKLHPDRFARADARERLFSVQQATALNDAYKTLRDPVKRAEYLLALAGVKLEDGRAPGAAGAEGDKVDPELLMEILELREELASAKASNDQPTLERMIRNMRVRALKAYTAIESTFAASGNGVPSPAHAATIAEQLVKLRYFQRFLDEAEGRGEEI